MNRFFSRRVVLILSMALFLLPVNSFAGEKAHSVWGVGLQLGFIELGAQQNLNKDFILRGLGYARRLAISSGCIPVNGIDDLIVGVQNSWDTRSMYPRITQYRQNLALYIENNCDCSDSVSQPGPPDNPSFITSGRYYKIVNKNSGKILDIGGARKDNGGMAMQMQNTGSPSNQWQFIPAADGYYKIINKNSGKVLAVSLSSRSNGGNAIQWEDQGQADIFWRLIPAGDGYYKIENRNSKLFLAISRGTKENGAYAIQWEDQGQADLYWRMDPQ